MWLRILTATVVLLLLTSPTHALSAPGPIPVSPATGREAIPMPGVFDNETVYHGDIVVNGTRRLVIRDVNFTLFGSIIAKDHATVIIENALLTLNLTEKDQYNITIRDYSNLTIKSSLVRSASGVYLFNLYLFNETRAYFEEARFENSHEWYGSAKVVVKNSKVRWVTCYGSVVVNVTNSEVQIALSASDNARVWLWNTKAAMLSALLKAELKAVDCVVSGPGIKCYDDARVWLVNVTGPGGGRPKISFMMAKKAVAYVAWHVRSIVSLSGAPVKGAEVIAFFQNGSVATSGLTDASGSITLDLLEAVVRPSGEERMGSYTLMARYGQLVGEAEVEVEGNTEVLIEVLSTLVITCLDGDGEPVKGVKLELSGQARTCTSATNASGACAFVLLSSGSYSIEAYFMGVRVASAHIEIADVGLYERSLSCAIYDLAILVVAQDGSPVANAHVILTLPNGTQIAEGLTNASGVVVFDNLPASNYTLSIEAEGFLKASVEISLEHEDQLEEIELKPAQPERPPLPVELVMAGAVAVIVPLVAFLALKKWRRRAAEGEEEGGEGKGAEEGASS